MRLVRGIVNALLMATLVKPVARLALGRWRKRVQESPAATIGIPVQEILEAALIEELVPPATDSLSSEETLEQRAGRGTIRTLLLVGVVIAVVAVSASAIATVIRRRRELAAAEAEDTEWVAVPVDAPSEEATEAVAEEALVE